MPIKIVVTSVLVDDQEKALRFYRDILGMSVETFGAGRTALKFGRQKFNLHQAGREFLPKADRPTPGSADLCLIATTPLAAVVAHLEKNGVALEEGLLQFGVGLGGRGHRPTSGDGGSKLIVQMGSPPPPPWQLPWVMRACSIRANS